MPTNIIQFGPARVSRQGATPVPADDYPRPALLPHRLANAMRDDEALRAIEDRLKSRHAPEPGIDWGMLAAAIIGGMIVGVLAVCLPAVIIAWVIS